MEKINYDYRLFNSKHKVPLSNFIVDFIDKPDHHNFDTLYKAELIPTHYWHYHHSYGANEEVIDWTGDKYYEDQINKKIMERHAFPAVFRAGHTFEGPVARAWLNKWIPFDFSSRAPHKYWESCGSSWEPIADDNRIIFRSLDAEFPWWSNGTEIDKAFKQASEGNDVLISFFSHDFKDFNKHFDYIFKVVNYYKNKYNSACVEYVDALDGIRIALNKFARGPLKINIRKDDKITITTNREIYQDIPYVVIKKNSGYEHLTDIKKISNTCWEIANYDKVGIAVSDDAGYTSVEVI